MIWCRTVFFLNFLCPSIIFFFNISLNSEFNNSNNINNINTNYNTKSSNNNRIFSNSWYMSNQFEFTIIYTWTISSLTFSVCVRPPHKLTYSYHISSHTVTDSMKSEIFKKSFPCQCMCVFLYFLITVNDTEMLSFFTAKKWKKLVTIYCSFYVQRFLFSYSTV